MNEKLSWKDAKVEIHLTKKADENGVNGCVVADNVAVMMTGLQGVVLHCAELAGMTAMEVVARVAAGLAAMEAEGNAVDQG